MSYEFFSSELSQTESDSKEPTVHKHRWAKKLSPCYAVDNEENEEDDAP